MTVEIPPFLLKKPVAGVTGGVQGRVRHAYIDRSIERLVQVVKAGLITQKSLSRNGLFQKLDPRVKVLFLVLFIAITSIKTDVASELAIAMLVMPLVVLSKLDFLGFYRRILVYTLLFGLAITFPALFNVFIAGDVVFPVLDLPHAYQWWIYQIPQQIGITRQGLYSVAVLNLRIMNSLAISLLVIHTTSFSDIVRALGTFRVPGTFLMIISLCHKYIFVLAGTVDDLFLAKKSRLAGVEPDREARVWITGRVAYLFRKSRQRYEDIFGAMEARGFSGKILFAPFPRLDVMNRCCGVIFLLTFAGLLWM